MQELGRGGEQRASLTEAELSSGTYIQPHTAWGCWVLQEEGGVWICLCIPSIFPPTTWPLPNHSPSLFETEEGHKTTESCGGGGGWEATSWVFAAVEPRGLGLSRTQMHYAPLEGLHTL